ncbi:RNA polymerase sigma factor [uncultured Robinsoniella sp.]|uniref:RNA polymerase sigma factor n=1 Tax=uncultured Robinsoniella sp. TaxID=904190 RepID=UPI00374E39DE
MENTPHNLYHNQSGKDCTNDELNQFIDQAVAGDKNAMEYLLLSVQDLIFNLALRMLGTIPDAEDAVSEITIRIMTHLDTFRKESTFSTWAFRIAVNHLKNYKKSMFATRPLSFEFYGNDIRNGAADDIPDPEQRIDQPLLEQELKLSCTNVMLQCLDQESRCIFILGTMFKADSKIAGEILNITPEAYRQRLTRIRKKMAAFLDEYCELGKEGFCRCQKRIPYAIQTHRLNPQNMEYTSLQVLPERLLISCKNAMEQIDDLSLAFSGMHHYRTPENARLFFTRLLNTNCYKIIEKADKPSGDEK